MGDIIDLTEGQTMGAEVVKCPSCGIKPSMFPGIDCKACQAIYTPEGSMVVLG